MRGEELRKPVSASMHENMPLPVNNYCKSSFCPKKRGTTNQNAESDKKILPYYRNRHRFGKRATLDIDTSLRFDISDNQSGGTNVSLIDNIKAKSSMNNTRLKRGGTTHITTSKLFMTAACIESDVEQGSSD